MLKGKKRGERAFKKDILFKKDVRNVVSSFQNGGVSNWSERISRVTDLEICHSVLGGKKSQPRGRTINRKRILGW